MTKNVMFNPYTGTPRHPSDIASDPEGLLILEPGAPLRAACTDDMVPTRGMDDAEWQELFRLREMVRARETALRRIVQTQSLPTAHEIARLTLHGLGA